MRRSIGVAALLCLCLAVPQAARSDPILDQQYVPSYVPTGELYASMWADLGSYVRAQTFTVGISGLLTSVEVLLGTNGTDGGMRTFDIVSTDGGVPDLAAAPLATATIAFPAESPLAYYSGLLAVPLMVEAGTVLAIADRGLAGGSAYWSGHYDYTADPAYNALLSHYGPGAAYGPGWDGPVGPLGGDLGFRTYVDPDYAEPPPEPIPEPATLMLLGTGLATLGLAGRRRRR